MARRVPALISILQSGNESMGTSSSTNAWILQEREFRHSKKHIKLKHSIHRKGEIRNPRQKQVCCTHASECLIVPPVCVFERLILKSEMQRRLDFSWAPWTPADPEVSADHRLSHQPRHQSLSAYAPGGEHRGHRASRLILSSTKRMRAAKNNAVGPLFKRAHSRKPTQGKRALIQWNQRHFLTRTIKANVFVIHVEQLSKFAYNSILEL